MMERKLCSGDAAQQEKQLKKAARIQSVPEKSQRNECRIFRKGATEQKKAALARKPYKGSQVPKSLTSRPDTLKWLHISQSPQQSPNKTVLEQPVNPASSMLVLPAEGNILVKLREGTINKKKNHHNAELSDVQEKLYIYQTDQKDKYATIHHASRNKGEILYEFRIYDFTKLNAVEKRHAKRNCREWKARRRFFDSWKHGDLVLVGLFYPGWKSVRSVPQVLILGGLALEPRSKSLRRSWDDDSDGSEKESKQIVLQRNHLKSQQFKTDVTREPASSHLENKVLFFHGARAKTASQKDKARRIQQAKRQQKRAKRKAERDSSQTEQNQRETSAATDNKSPQRWREWLANDTESNLQPWIGFLKSLPAEETYSSDSTSPASQNQPVDGWRWSSDGGWLKQSAFLDDGSYQTATFWSTSGGYIKNDITPVTSPDPNPVTFPTPPPEKRRASPSSPKKYGSENLNHTTISAIVKMILEYIFSSDNLCKDRDLRKQMNQEGFVRLGYLVSLTRIRRLTNEVDIVYSCCKNSSTLEIKEDGGGMDGALTRMKEGWADWIRFEEDFCRKEAAERARMEEFREQQEQIKVKEQYMIQRERLRMEEARIERILREEAFLMEALLSAKKPEEKALKKSSQEEAAEIKDHRKEAAIMKELQRRESKRARKSKRKH